jgi:RNA polymerase sigma-70 factor, ECF subfamily
MSDVMEDQRRRTAVEEAYRAHADDVYRVAFAILRDPDAAADATHEAFARAHARWDQYDTNRPLRPWLHGIVAKASLDALRRRRVRERAIPVLARVTEIASIGGAPDPGVEVARREVVDAGLATLAPKSRAAVVLRHYYGYDYGEIGALLGTSPGNVGSILSRAHADLRRRLATEAPGSTAASDEAVAAGAPRDRSAG